MIASFLTLAALAFTGATTTDGFQSYRPALSLSEAWPTKVAWRAFTSGGRDSLLLLDPYTLETSLAPAPPALVPVDWETLRQRFPEAPWLKALDEARSDRRPIQDAGIRRTGDSAGVDLTVDLCPSRKPLDRSFFRDVLAALEGEQVPVPIGLSVSGTWMRRHGADLLWLKELADAGRIRPVWINHSFHHRVDPKASLARNFLLEPGTDLAAEVFLTERAMLRHGLLPSPFFRFPGLVSRDTLVDRILSWGLVPVGSDAWLAKNQKARDESIVLVHANGNEPLGLMKFRLLLRQHAAEIRAHRWVLYDLREGLAGAE